MNSVRIAWKYIKQLIKRPTGLVLLTAGPLILMFVLGQAFSGIFSAPTVSLDMTIGYYSSEQGSLYKGFSAFITQQAGHGITGKAIESIPRGKEMTSEGTYQAFIIIHEQERRLELLVNSNSRVKAGIIEKILRGFLSRFNVQSLVTDYMHGEMASIKSLEEVDVVSHTTLNASRQPRAIDYFGITIPTMAVLFGAFLGQYGVAKEKTLHTLARIYTAPVIKTRFLLGICLGTFPALIIQITILFLTGKYVINI